MRRGSGSFRKIHGSEVVYEVSSAYYEIAFRTEVAELTPRFEMLFGRQRRVERERDYRDVGLGKQMYEGRPYAVVESPLHGFPISLSKRRFDVGERLGEARCGIFDLVERSRESEKVVDGLGFRRDVDEISVHVPVRADEDYGFRFGESFSEFAQGFDVRVAGRGFEREHRRSVRKEKGRKKHVSVF